MKKGFSIIEMTVALAIVMLILFIFVIIFNSMMKKYDHSLQTENSVNNVENALKFMRIEIAHSSYITKEYNATDGNYLSMQVSNGSSTYTLNIKKVGTNLVFNYPDTNKNHIVLNDVSGFSFNLIPATPNEKNPLSTLYDASDQNIVLTIPNFRLEKSGEHRTFIFDDSSLVGLLDSDDLLEAMIKGGVGANPVTKIEFKTVCLNSGTPKAKFKVGVKYYKMGQNNNYAREKEEHIDVTTTEQTFNITMSKQNGNYDTLTNFGRVEVNFLDQSNNPTLVKDFKITLPYRYVIGKAVYIKLSGSYISGKTYIATNIFSCLDEK